MYFRHLLSASLISIQRKMTTFYWVFYLKYTGLIKEIEFLIRVRFFLLRRYIIKCLYLQLFASRSISIPLQWNTPFLYSGNFEFYRTFLKIAKQVELFLYFFFKFEDQYLAILAIFKGLTIDLPCSTIFRGFYFLYICFSKAFLFYFYFFEAQSSKVSFLNCKTQVNNPSHYFLCKPPNFKLSANSKKNIS